MIIFLQANKEKKAMAKKKNMRKFSAVTVELFTGKGLLCN